MKKPLYTQDERMLIQDPKSLDGAKMRLYIAKKNFQKVFMKTFIGVAVKKSIGLIERLLK